MLIGEVSSKTGLSRDTIRFYEKKGLIEIGGKERRDNGYKEYSNDTLMRLKSIKLMKGFGFTLNEISDLLDLMVVNEATCTNVESLAREKIEIIKKKISELEQIKKSLQDGLSNCKVTICNTSLPEENCPAILADKI